MRQVGEGIQLTYGNEPLHGVKGDFPEENLFQNRERLSSESSISKQVRSHRRAISDPFDTPEMEGITDGMDGLNADDYLLEEEEHALPTLQRFPFAETNNKNCWSEPPVGIFHVRGPNYLSDKKKKKADKYLLRSRGCDLFLSDKPNKCRISSLKGALGGNLRKEPSLLIRLTFPWGLLIQYYEIPEKYAKFMRPGENPPMDGFSPAERNLALWLSGSTDYRNDRLKLIAYVPEGPWIVRNMVTGKPAIIGRKLPVKYDYTPLDGSKMDFLECNLDIGNSTATARRIVSVCRRYMSSLSVDIGFVIEGKTAEDLPEEMMGAIRVHEVDPIKAPTISSG